MFHSTDWLGLKQAGCEAQMSDKVNLGQPECETERTSSQICLSGNSTLSPLGGTIATFRVSFWRA